MPQGFNDSTNAINDHFGTLWAAGAYSAYQVVYRNEDSDYTNQRNPWVRLTITEGLGSKNTLGVAGCYRFVGVITAQIFVRANVGTGLAHAMADLAADFLRVKNIEANSSGLIRTKTPSTIAQGVDLVGWYQVNVSVQYQRDVVTS